MSRSIWKGPFSLLKLTNRKSNLNLFIWSRSSMILPQYVGKNVQIYNGKNWTRRTIVEDMVGHKFGEFSYTKKKTIHKTNKTKRTARTN